MHGIGLFLLIVMVLGFGFLAVGRSAETRRMGPLSFALLVALIATIFISTYDGLPPGRGGQLPALLSIMGVMALLAVEAALISHWARARYESLGAYLVVFTSVTLFGWMLTCLALWNVMPYS